MFLSSLLSQDSTNLEFFRTKKGLLSKFGIALLLFCSALDMNAQSFIPQYVNIEYYLVGIPTPQKIRAAWGQPFSDSYLRLDMNFNAEEGRYQLKLLASAQLFIESIDCQATYLGNTDTRYLCNGFQSWTTSREYSPDERIPKLNPILNAYSKNAGDYFFYSPKRPKGQLHSWTWTYWRQDQTYEVLASLADNSGYTSFRFEPAKNLLHIEKDCKRLFLNTDDQYEVFDLLHAQLDGPNAYGDFMAIYARTWHLKHNSPNSFSSGAMGWTSWYHYYADIDEAILMKNLNAFAKEKIPIDYFQIDDGYQKNIGDWLETNKKFPKGMKNMADEIHAKGYKAGIWLAPFICSKRSDVYKKHPDWIVRKENGKPLRVAKNVIWKGPYYALNTYQADVKEHIKATVKTILEDWNYDLIKVDFLFAAALEPILDKTRAELMYDAMLLLREAAGPDKKILGCGVPLAPSFGLVDYCRIGNDAHLDWEFKVLKKLHAHERPSTWSTLTNTINRFALSGNMFQNDPDVFILRSQKTKLNETQKKTLFLVNNLLGELLFTSDYIPDYNAKQLEQYLSAFPLRAKSAVQIFPFDKDAYRIEFRIGIRRYVAYINLSDKANNLSIPSSHLQYYEAETNQILETKELSNIRLNAFESKCFYVVEGDDVELLGGEGHLFSGAEVELLEWSAADKMHLNRHSKSQLKKPLYFLVKDSKLEQITVNDEIQRVQKLGNYQGIRVN